MIATHTAITFVMYILVTIATALVVAFTGAIFLTFDSAFGICVGNREPTEHLRALTAYQSDAIALVKAQLILTGRHVGVQRFHHGTLIPLAVVDVVACCVWEKCIRRIMVRISPYGASTLRDFFNCDDVELPPACMSSPSLRRS
ncbi:unnamed protein product [Ceratitis capitata]|uniref:(Mediterranean fruit fly) hypothetical protein n=1 Tax=Ceratitis capitata TaxID=7213 RepID=A0A811V1P0_CERCA|nr:unnamed protein product [Ceratitis capitata]